MSRTVSIAVGIGAVMAATLLALAACKPATNTAQIEPSSAPALSGSPSVTYTPPASGLQVTPTAPKSQSVNPPKPTPGAPPANAGDLQAQKGLGPGGPVNTPRRLHRHDSADWERG